MPFDNLRFTINHDLELNGCAIESDEEGDEILDWFNDKFYRISICPFCSSLLSRTDYDGYDEELSEVNWDHEGEYVFVTECQNCGFWQSYWQGEHNTSGDYEWEGRISKLSEYPETIPEGCNVELSQYLKAHPNFWQSIDPLRLEKLIADIFRANYKNSEVFHVGQPNDGGIDVVFIDSSNKKWLIQVKRRGRQTASESVSTLRNLLGVLLLEDSKYGIVVTSANQFSYWAKKANKKALDLGYTIELIDRGKLTRLLDPLLPYREWIYLLRDKKPEWIEMISSKMPNRKQITIYEYLKNVQAKSKR